MTEFVNKSGVGSKQCDFTKAAPVANDPMPPLPGLSPIAGKKEVVKSRGG
jgi:hypothetical protein